MTSNLDLLPDVTQEDDPDKKRHHDTLVYVQELSRVISPPGKKLFALHWGELCWKAGIQDSAEYSEDLTWTQLVTVWEYLLFEEAAPRLIKAREWVERYYKK